jgi:hypothetical protein
VSAATELVIGDVGGEHLTVRALSRNPPDLFDSSEADSIACEVEIVAGPFRGDLRADLVPEDFQSFLDEAEALSRAADGTATFSASPGRLAFSLAAAGTGVIRVRGEALDTADGPNHLHFAFDIDRSWLPAICRSLQELLTAFPSRSHFLPRIRSSESEV